MRLRSLSLQKCNKNFGTSPFASTCLRDIIPATSEYNTSLSVWLLTDYKYTYIKKSGSANIYNHLQKSWATITHDHDCWDWNIMSHIHSWSAMIVNDRRSHSDHPIIGIGSSGVKRHRYKKSIRLGISQLGNT